MPPNEDIIAYSRASELARENFNIPHVVWLVTHKTHSRYVIRERSEGPPLTGEVKHVCTTDGIQTVQQDEPPEVWPPEETKESDGPIIPACDGIWISFKDLCWGHHVTVVFASTAFDLVSSLDEPTTTDLIHKLGADIDLIFENSSNGALDAVPASEVADWHIQEVLFEQDGPVYRMLVTYYRKA